MKAESSARPDGHHRRAGSVQVLAFALALSASACRGSDVGVLREDGGTDGAADADAALESDGSSDTDATFDSDAARDADTPSDTGNDASIETSSDVAIDTSTDTRSDADDARPCVHPHGPAMILVDAKIASYCIDTTEVTRGQYNEFLAAGAPFEGLVPLFCSSMSGAKPARDDTPSERDMPMQPLQWCWAEAYCRWAGKRLCGEIGKSTFEVSADGRSEWGYACANGELGTAFTYGSTYDGKKCWSLSYAFQNVATAKDCHGTAPPFDALFDMNGNVSELDGRVGMGTSGPIDARGRGGSAFDGDARCDAVGPYDFKTATPRVGFRCCADP
jgi:formylglycine-generating enzyme